MVPAKQYAQYVADMTWDDIQGEPLLNTRRSLLDWMGVTIAGLHEPSSQLLSATLGRQEGLPRDGTSVALLLGYAGYSSEFEQTHVPSSCHISTVSWPAFFDWLWATEGGGRHVPVKDWLIAFVAGFEVAAHVGRHLGPQTFRRSWHNTPMFGPIAAAVTVARSAGRDANAIAMAMGTASALVGGAQASFGTHAGALGVANAAHLGRLCGALIGPHFDGPTGLAEGPGHALWNILRPEVPDLPALPSRAPEEMRWNAFKAYPSALLTHAAIECALQLRADVPAEGVSRLEITLHPDAMPRVDRPDWAGVDGARYSVQYNVWQAWLTGCVVADTFHEAKVKAAKDRPSAPITIRTDPELPLFGARVAVASSTGERHETEVLLPTGFAERPLTALDLRTKFAACVAPHVGAEAGERMADLVLEGGIGQLGQAADLFRLWVERAFESISQPTGVGRHRENAAKTNTSSMSPESDRG